jgi:hypothetical protein
VTQKEAVNDSGPIWLILLFRPCTAIGDPIGTSGAAGSVLSECGHGKPPAVAARRTHTTSLRSARAPETKAAAREMNRSAESMAQAEGSTQSGAGEIRVLLTFCGLAFDCDGEILATAAFGDDLIADALLTWMARYKSI